MRERQPIPQHFELLDRVVHSELLCIRELAQFGRRLRMEEHIHHGIITPVL
jgi:hypothetical protein